MVNENSSLRPDNKQSIDEAISTYMSETQKVYAIILRITRISLLAVIGEYL